MWRNLARRMGFALLRWAMGEIRSYLMVEAPELLESARALTEAADNLPGEPGGEYKRHWVYTQLIENYPEEKKRDASAAIEIALQHRP